MPTFSLERIEGTRDSYKIYLGRGEPHDGQPATPWNIGHGLWVATLSDFDNNGEAFRAQLIEALNAWLANKRPSQT